jgi:hypothetical protein
MRAYFTLAFLFVTSFTFAQSGQSAMGNKADTTQRPVEKFRPYERHTFMLSLSAGIGDWYKQTYSLSNGYTDGKGTGFIPVYLQIERTISNHISIAVNLMTDKFYYNYAQEGSGNGVSFLRYGRDNVHAIAGGLTGYYHFTQANVRNLDLFLGVGATVNNITHSAYPQSDSTISKTEHTVSPHLKVGARYYTNKYVSFYGDAGYDQISLVSLGISCRFY